MANKQDFKDRKRDRNPRNAPPRAQVKEQNIKGKAAKDVPARPATRKPTKKTAKPRARVADFKDDRVRGGETTRKGKSINPLLRVTDTESGTIHDEAARLAIRATGQTSPREVVTVEGNKLEVVARPEVLHPVELLPHQRDTVIKDDLRDQGDPEATAKADGTYPVEPPDWRDETHDYEKGSPDGNAVKSPPAKAKK